MQFWRYIFLPWQFKFLVDRHTYAMCICSCHLSNLLPVPYICVCQNLSTPSFYAPLCPSLWPCITTEWACEHEHVRVFLLLPSILNYYMDASVPSMLFYLLYYFRHPTNSLLHSKMPHSLPSKGNIFVSFIYSSKNRERWKIISCFQALKRTKECSVTKHFIELCGGNMFIHSAPGAYFPSSW